MDESVVEMIKVPNWRLKLWSAFFALAFGIGASTNVLAGTEWRYSVVTANDGVPLAVAETGNPEGPALLFLHGYSQALTAWREQFDDPALQSAFRMVAFDLRGHGASGKPWANDAYESRDWADDVAAVMTAMEIESPVLIGWSGGASVAAAYIRHYGDDELSGLVLAGGLLRMAEPEAPSENEARDAAPNEDQALVVESVQKMSSDDIRKKLSGTESLVSMLTVRALSESEEKEALAFNLMSPAYVSRAMVANRTVYNDIQGKIGVPTLLIHGSEDRLVPADLSMQNRKYIPGGELKIYDGLGHAVFLDDPARFNEDLAAFVTRVQGND